MKEIIKIHSSDSVAAALKDIKKGFVFGTVTAKDDIPAGHKIALEDIREGESIIKYGSIIGTASCFIPKGSHVHTHNMKTSLSGFGEYVFKSKNEYRPTDTGETFHGYLREDGRVGIRNSILIIPTVGCANDAAKEICEKASALLPEADIHVFTHPYGCSQLGEDSDNTSKCIAALCTHPNAGGALLVSLGCENNNIKNMSHFISESDRIKFLVLQKCSDEIAEGVELVSKIFDVVKNDRRSVQPISRLTVGFKCGGSDGFSGITANPLCGKITDSLPKAGASVILTEVPEMFGAEERLFERCSDRAVFDKAVEMINGFKEYFISHSQPIYENPSPGNKDGGITTLEEKSLGCITKGGGAVVTDVIGMYEKCRKNGLTLLDGPGNDIVSVTNLAAAGAAAVIFTTGRGTPIGGPVPTIKVSSNTLLFTKKPHWIDFNAGAIADGADEDECAILLKDLIIRTANGKKTKNEINKNEQIAIFKNGVTL